MLLPVAWWDLVMPALSALSDTLCPDAGLKLWNRPLPGFRWGPQAVKQTITWVLMTGLRLWNRPLPGFWWRASSCETDHYLGSDDGPQAVKQTITWVPVRASGCETDHYLGSDDGPQAVKQTITWVLMTGLKLWNRPLPGFWWRASSCETDHYLGSDDGPQAVKQTIIVTLGSDDGPRPCETCVSDYMGNTLAE